MAYFILHAPRGRIHQIVTKGNEVPSRRENPKKWPVTKVPRLGDLAHETWEHGRGWVKKEAAERSKKLHERRSHNLTEISREEYVYKVIKTLFPALIITPEQMAELFPHVELKKG